MLQFVNTLALSDGGPARNAYELHQAFNAAAACTATMIVIHSSAFDATVAASDEGSTQFKGRWFRTDLGLLETLKVISQADVIVVHGYYLPWIPIVVALGRLLGKPVFLTPHGSLTKYQQGFSRLRKIIFDGTLGAVTRCCLTRVLLGSERESEELAARFPRMNRTVVGVGTTLPHNRVLASRSGTSTREILIVSISRIAQKKRVDLMIQAVRTLRDEGEDARLVLAGSGEQRLLDELEALVAELDLETYVTFVGEVHGQAKINLLNQADVFLAPSDDENFGISVAEALSHGVACVVSHHVASADGLTPPAGIRLSDRSPATIASSIRELSAIDPQARSRSAQSFAAERFDWARIAERWIHALGGPSPRDGLSNGIAGDSLH